MQFKHPLLYAREFRFVGYDGELGGTATYRATTKVVSEIMSSRGERVPHTQCYYRMLDELCSAAPSNVAAVAWVRRLKHEELKQAIATLLMMDKEPVLVRSFEP